MQQKIDTITEVTRKVFGRTISSRTANSEAVFTWGDHHVAIPLHVFKHKGSYSLTLYVVHELSRLQARAEGVAERLRADRARLLSESNAASLRGDFCLRDSYEDKITYVTAQLEKYTSGVASW